jgi:hypothetical protein
VNFIDALALQLLICSQAVASLEVKGRTLFFSLSKKTLDL